jgi:hypothetical protein
MTERLKWLLITIGIQALLVMAIFGKFLWHPNDYFFEVGADAVKSLMCMAYYVKYDSGLHFTGEIYPYGEHIVYADSQFPLVLTLQWLRHLGYDWSGYIPGILNSAMMWSFVPCAIFIFLILASFNSHHWFNGFAAIGITMLSPQLLRFAGHFSLSYLFFIPMEWYFMMKLMEGRKRLLWMLLMIVTLLWFGLAHLYYMANIMLFVLAFIFVYLVRNRKTLKAAALNSLPLLVASFLPYVLTAVLLKLTDPVTDRVQTPWGFFFNYASFNSVFLPPMYNPLNFLQLKNGFAEGYAYVGVVGWTGLVLLAVRLVTRARKWKHHVLLAPEFLKTSLWASVLVLFFSFAFPFKLGLEFLLDYLGVVNQFRSEGRFAWIFYYVFSVFSVYFIFIHLRAWKRRREVFMYSFILLLMVFGWSNDVLSNLKIVINPYKPYPFKKDFYDSHPVSSRLQKAGRSADEFQCTLALPLYHNGSEKFWFTRSELALYAGLTAAYDTRLPMIDSHCGRTSLSETMKALQLVSDTLIAREMLADFPSQKPILLLVTPDSLSDNEKILVSKSKLIVSDSALALYELPLQALHAPFDAVRNEFESQKDSLRQSGDYRYRRDGDVPVFGFSQEGSSPFEKGIKKNGELSLLNKVIAPADTAEVLEASVWIRVFIDSYESPELVVREYNSSNKLVQELVSVPKENPDNALGWQRQYLRFTIHNSSNRIEILLRGKLIEANHFLLRPANVNVFSQPESGGSFWKNNFYIPAHSIRP